MLAGVSNAAWGIDLATVASLGTHSTLLAHGSNRLAKGFCTTQPHCLISGWFAGRCITRITAVGNTSLVILFRYPSCSSPHCNCPFCTQPTRPEHQQHHSSHQRIPVRVHSGRLLQRRHRCPAQHPALPRGFLLPCRPTVVIHGQLHCLVRATTAMTPIFMVYAVMLDQIQQGAC